jgi:hypothetical protein
MPVAEAQAGAIARHLGGGYNLPEKDDMERRLIEQEAKMKARFVRSRRHTMQVIPEDFLRELKADLQAGKVRARAGTGIAFVAARTGSSP